MNNCNNEKIMKYNQTKWQTSQFKTDTQKY